MADSHSTKRCSKCGEVKAAEAFGRRASGALKSECRQCHREYRRAQRKTPEYKAYQRDMQRDWRNRNPDKAAAARRRSYESRKARGYKRWKIEDPHITQARWKLRNALITGEITKPDRCSSCGASGNIHGHHSDYSKPFDVQWVCTRCHGAIHRQLRAALAPAGKETEG